MAEVVCVIDGEAYPGWQRVQIRRSLDELADTFGVSLVSPLSSVDGPPALDEWSPVQVYVDDELVLDGWVLTIEDGYDAESYSLSITGASKAIDLVHCTVPTSKRWPKTTVFDVVSDLAAPFDLDVIATEVTPTITNVAVDLGETIFAAIDRISREYGLRVTSLADGTVVLTRTGDRQATTRLQLGKNILRGQRSRSMEERFSRYVYKGQKAGTDDEYGEAAANPRAEVIDAGVLRERPYVVQEDAGRGSKGLQARAEWERNTRAGRATRLRYEVTAGPGDLSTCWQEGTSGRVWDANTLVGVKDHFLGIDEDLLVVAVDLELDVEQGHRCSLELIHPDAYLPERPPKTRKKGETFAW